MLADDLVGTITLDLLRAGIPARDEAFRVEHIDRIIRDRIEQQLEAALFREVLRAAGDHGTFGLTFGYKHVGVVRDPSSRV